VAVAGAGVDSPVGALLLGTRRVRPRAAVVVIAVWRGRRLLAAGAGAVVLATVLAGRRR
jgi:hypothetical protein